MILVIGATGMVGNEICRLLKQNGLNVRAMVRSTPDKSKILKLKEIGVETVIGDLRDNTTFGQALQGASTVISTISSMPFSYVPDDNDIQRVDLEGMMNLIDAAKVSGVKHFIYTSFSKNIDMEFPLSNAKRAVEEHLKKSGMTYTILRPGFFMEVWLSAGVGFDARGGKVNICGTGTNPVAFVYSKDVAKFAVECITNPYSKNAILELGGPQNISQLDVVKIFEEVLGNEIEVQHIPVEALQVQFNSAKDGMQKSFSGLMLSIAAGDMIEMKEVRSKFIVGLVSVKDFVNFIA